MEGLQDFKGKIMHSARWDWSYSLEDKNVGIIGNGMSIFTSLQSIVSYSPFE